MTGRADIVHVLAAPALDPGERRIEMELSAGLSLAEIVASAVPMHISAEVEQMRVSLVTDAGVQVILPAFWGSVRPKPGVRVVIRVVPGKDALRSVLSIVVSLAAVALGGVGAGPLAAAIGIGEGLANSLIVLGATMIGNLLINALIPPVQPEDEKRRNSYSITGWRNRMVPNGAVPFVLGTLRYAPPFAATPYTEIVGDNQYIRVLFTFGEGEVEITDMRLGETSLDEYDEVEIETRAGLDSDLPVTLYPRQVVEETIGVELIKPLPRDDAGDVIAGQPAEEEPVVRTTGADASGASIVLAWPGGLIGYNGDGAKWAHTVKIRIEQRPVDGEAWTEAETLEIKAAKTEGFYRQHTWSFPSRGRWQIRLTMLTDETEDTKVQQRTNWAALQTIRPEYPLAYPRPLALVALRIKATHQLNGQLDNFNALVSRVTKDWDGAAWVSRVSSNPAAAYRAALQHPAMPKAQTDAALDLDQMADWHGFCEAKALTYNRVLEDTGTTLRDVLTEIAVAGRATPRHDGLKWGVVIDRPTRDDLVIDHINPRNSWNFSWKRAYTKPPHAFVVTFLDAGNDYKETQRQIRWPGYEGDITITEELALPGKVHADEVWREARRRQLEVIHRPDVYEATQESALRVATRGDTVMLSHDVISRVQAVAGVRAVEGRAVELDNLVEMTEGESYAIRFRVFSEADTIGVSVVRTVRTVPGETRLLTVMGSGEMPMPGTIVHFGPAASESYQQIVSGVEITQDQCSIIRLVDASPQIDEILDATEIPAWSSRVGAELDPSLLTPGAPRFTAIRSGLAGTGSADLVTYLLEPGPGAVAPAQYQVEHKLDGAASWTTATIPAANGGGQIDSYSNGQLIRLRVLGLSSTGVSGPMSAEVAITVGVDDAPIPDALADETIMVTGSFGAAHVTLATGADDALAQVQLYRVPTGDTLNRSLHAAGAPFGVAPSTTVQYVDGDGTRTNLLADGGFDNPAAWTVGADWSVASGVATHVPGANSSISHPITVTDGLTYRCGYEITGYVAGGVKLRFSGGATLADGDWRSGDGPVRETITVADNDAVGFVAGGALDASIDNAFVFLPSAASIGDGTYDYYLEPQNADGVPGPVSGPFTTEIL